MPSGAFAPEKNDSAMRAVPRFLKENGTVAVLVSALLLVPCFWHTRIQAGDLGSHVYNAWLAQLIAHGQARGLVLARMWNNVLFDVLLLRVANATGFAAAEKIVVSLAVLCFFWGCFAFLAQFSARLPWRLTPLLAILCYGYVFHMGFMNYYLSCGLALLAITLILRGGAGNWLLAIPFSGLSLLAHPIGFVLSGGLSLYLLLQRNVKRWMRPILPLSVVAGAAALKQYLMNHAELQADWRPGSFLYFLGHDQFNLFGANYVALARVLLAWIVFCAMAAGYDWLFRSRGPARNFWLAVELYALAVVAMMFVPQDLRVSLYAGWIGLLVSRLTLFTMLFAFLVLACLRQPRWTAAGNVVCAVLFFAFLFRDTGRLDRLEASARLAIQGLPLGTRIVAVANPPSEDWRVQFLYHSIERACIGRCFSYANYEPSSGQFRVRALPGNYYVTTSVEQADDMASGDYVVRPRDLPLTALYQCGENDYTQICALPLRAGQKTEDPESEPGPIPAEDDDK
jgi:hypothetical protein